MIEKWLMGAELADLSKVYPKEVAEIDGLRDHGLFCCEPPRDLAFGIDWDGICDKILHERKNTVVELTQRCNLRCKYCTFGGGFKDHRTLSSREMSTELLEKTIDSALSHGDKLDEIGIRFYGGEPLSAFELLQGAVLYAQRRASGKKVRFSVTTNATLIDKPRARFLRDAGFSVIVSVDGPQYMHDRYRVYPNGKGSYADTLKGLKTLLDVYPPNLHNKISLNMVVPSSEWIAHLEGLWDDEPWLPRTLRAQATRVEAPGGLDLPPRPSSSASQSLKEEWLSCIKKKETGRTTLGVETFDMSLARLHQRPTFARYRQTFFPNGCCIPGARKIYVQVDGTYQICERVHGVPTIGSVTQGINFSQIKRIIEEYSQLSLQDCKDCSVISICGLCYLHAYKSGRFDIKTKRKACSVMKRSREQNLKLYGLISQKYPDKLDEWDKVKIE
ncbi:MAG: radical SAM protein [Planctomycetes bacterium]|nr:radical SAM protein [Planctomycetota bacterium]